MNVTAFNGAGRPGSRLIHASPAVPVPVKLGSYQALCGTTVRNVTRFEFTSTTPGNLCPECLKLSGRRDEHLTA